MPSIVQGFEYDIFISYRQNDNKYDGWVTEFASNLSKELEATLKGRVTIYFDANPHDGLLETHSVFQSVQNRIKCLILIPILSKTYCDESSFAWTNEFLPFIKNSSADQFGLNVKLNSGNIAARVLPVRIHDLAAEDIALVESAFGPIRSIDFIYRTSGVNRSLRPWDDDVIKNTKQPFYRDQINKVANAIDDILRGIKQQEKEISRESENKIDRIDRPKIQQASPAKKIIRKNSRSRLRVTVFAVVAILVLIFLFFGSRWYTKQRMMDYARLVLLPAIKRSTEENFRPPTATFDMAMKARQSIPMDSALMKLLPLVATAIPFKTDPPGARVFWKDYSKPQMAWRFAGFTPLTESFFPRDFLRVELRKEGYQTINYAGPPSVVRPDQEFTSWKMDPEGSLPEKMVRIPASTTYMFVIGLDKYGPKKVGEFLMDRFEVTNEQYKRFVDAGGYSNKAWWRFPFYNDGKIQSFETVMRKFVDRTGRPGPSEWEAGSYPDDQKNHPVTGVSWYEASAYAAFVKKRLPSVFHWSVAAETSRTEFIVPFSNFNGKGTVEVGSLRGYSSFGIYDIAGNVREWCANKTADPSQRFILGGGWTDLSYSFNDAYTQRAMDRGNSNGFRCIKEIGDASASEDLDTEVTIVWRNYRNEKPVDEKTFGILLRQYSYDKTPLRDSVKLVASAENYIVQKITFDAAYNHERVQAYIYLPKGAKAPYQPIIFFPGSGDIYSKKFDIASEVARLEFILKSGRVLVVPVYKGTHERHDEITSGQQNETVFYKDHVIMWRKDLGRTIDYLETRKDIQADHIGYLGWSWGGALGGIMPAVEKRIKAVVLNVGGMAMEKALPEVDQINFIPRVTQPVLMLNGKHDMFFPVETSQKPMFNLLGTPTKNKKIIIYETGHLVPRTEFVKETLLWFDKYLGKIKN